MWISSDGPTDTFLWIFGKEGRGLDMRIDLNGYCVVGAPEQMLTSTGCLSQLDMSTVQLDTLHILTFIGPRHWKSGTLREERLDVYVE
jgi:hypothetical protein